MPFSDRFRNSLLSDTRRRRGIPKKRRYTSQMRSKLDFGNSVSASASLSYITGKMKMIGHCNRGMEYLYDIYK